MIYILYIIERMYIIIIFCTQGSNLKWTFNPFAKLTFFPWYLSA